MVCDLIRSQLRFYLLVEADFSLVFAENFNQRKRLGKGVESDSLLRSFKPVVGNHFYARVCIDRKPLTKPQTEPQTTRFKKFLILVICEFW